MSQDSLPQIPALEKHFQELFLDGQYKEAVRIGLQCKAQYRQAGQEQSLEYAALLENLAACYRELRDFDPAETLLRRAIEIRSNLSGPSDPLAVRDLFALAALYELKGDKAAARETYHRAVLIQRKAARIIGPVVPPLVEYPAPVQLEPPTGPSPTGPQETRIPPPQTQTPPATEITRYGRVEYFSPMELQQEYPLRVGILIERHAGGVPEGARVSWARLKFQPAEAEPVLLIIPVATWLNISPFQRHLRVKEKADVFAEFKLIAPRLPPGEKGNLDIEIEYAGVLVHKLSLDITVQDLFRLGPLRLRRALLTGASFVTGVVFTIPGLLSVFDAIREIGTAISPPLLAFTLLAAVLLLAAGVALLRDGPRRHAQSF
jgi:tetratricopeptide (TPR) repeat protein